MSELLALAQAYPWLSVPLTIAVIYLGVAAAFRTVTGNNIGPVLLSQWSSGGPGKAKVLIPALFLTALSLFLLLPCHIIYSDFESCIRCAESRLSGEQIEEAANSCIASRS